MSFQKTKLNSELGRKVDRHLTKLGINTPQVKNNLSNTQKIEKIEKSFTDIMTALGLDLSNNSLQNTPNRVAKMYTLEKFWGMNSDNFPKCTTVDNGSDGLAYDQMITLKNVRILSDCEHHFVVIDGYATIAYIPKDRVIGLSKISRIAEYFSRRPQIQERLTQQIGETLKFILDTDHVAVHINAKHYCVISRGVEDQNVETGTAFLSGSFKDDPSTRSEFLLHIK
jgi:GTP cyclohydrolase I